MEPRAVDDQGPEFSRGPAARRWWMPMFPMTKSIASGMFLTMALVWLPGWSEVRSGQAIRGNVLVLLFLAIAIGLRFWVCRQGWRFLLGPNCHTRRTLILVGFAIVPAAWFAVEVAGRQIWLSDETLATARVWAMVVGIPLALLTAIQDPHELGNWQRRDPWPGWLVAWRMSVKAMMAGTALIMAAGRWNTIYLTLTTIFVVTASMDLAARLTKARSRRSIWWLSTVFSVVSVFALVFLTIAAFGITLYSAAACDEGATVRCVGLGHTVQLTWQLLGRATTLAGGAALVGLVLQEWVIVDMAQDLHEM